MTKPKSSHEIVIRFALTKGDDGDYPSSKDFSEVELLNLKTLCTFNLDLDFGKFEDDFDPFELLEVLIIYNGIDTYIDTGRDGKPEKCGLSWNKDAEQFDGYPAPIIKFTFKEPVNVEWFRQLVMSSTVNLCTSKQKENNSRGYYFEDYNGWVDALGKVETKQWIELMKDSNLFDGRLFKYVEDWNNFPMDPNSTYEELNQSVRDKVGSEQGTTNGKTVGKTKSSNVEANTFLKPLTPSPELAAIVGASPMPRSAIVKNLLAYIKEHGLRDPSDANQIITDDKLRALSGRDQISMLEMSEVLVKHLK